MCKDGLQERHKWIQPHYFLVTMLFFAAAGLLGGLALYYATTPDAQFPFISDLGETAPASCVFALFINLASMFGFACVYFRYGYLERAHLLETERQNYINSLSVFFGITTMLGMLIVANFPASQLRSTHLAGSMLFFVSLTVYAGIHSYLSMVSMSKLRDEFQSFIKVRMALFIFILMSFVSVAFTYYKGRTSFFYYDYWFHLCAISEWTTVGSFLTYLSTFCKEYSYVVYEDFFNIDIVKQTDKL